MKPKPADITKPHWAAKCCRAKRMPLYDDSCNCDIYRQEWVHVVPKPVPITKPCRHKDPNKGMDAGCPNCFRITTPPWGKSKRRT